MAAGRPGSPIAAPGPLTLTSRYHPVPGGTVDLRSVDVTPSLDDIIISTGHAPVAVDDSIVVPENGSHDASARPARAA